MLGDIDSLSELWDDAAEFVPPDDDAALLDAVWRLIDSPARRAELAERAALRATRFTPQRMAGAYLAAYREAMAVRGAAAAPAIDSFVGGGIRCAS